jgi:hypothetical protein
VYTRKTAERFCFITKELTRDPNAIPLLILLPIKNNTRGKLMAAVATFDANQKHGELLGTQWTKFLNQLSIVGNTLCGMGQSIVYVNDPILSNYNIWALIDSGGCQTSEWHFKFVVGLSHFLATLRLFVNTFVQRASKENDAYKALCEDLEYLTHTLDVISFHGRIPAVRKLVDWARHQATEWRVAQDDWKHAHILERLIPSVETLPPLIQRLELAKLMIAKSASCVARMNTD